MEQIVPGVWHWTAVHPNIKIPVHSYYLEDGGRPDRSDHARRGARLVRGARAAERRAADEPASLPLDRRVRRAVRRCGPVRASRPARVREGRARRALRLRRRAAGRDRRPRSRSHLPGRDRALHPWSRCSRARRRSRPPGAWRATHVRPGSPHGRAGATKQGLRATYRGLADLDFRHLLLAHGEPFVDTGREALAAFAGAGEGRED